MKSVLGLALLVGLFSFSAPFANAASTSNFALFDRPLAEFHPVSPGIFRGSRPEAQGIAILARKGIRTDLDVESDPQAIAAERAYAMRAGIRFISMPMSGFWPPKDAEVAQILRILADRQFYPIFVHCQHGHDRTGLIIGLYRVFYQHWTPAAAYHEMLQMGFHRVLIFLNHYYEQKTGFED